MILLYEYDNDWSSVSYNVNVVFVMLEWAPIGMLVYLCSQCTSLFKAGIGNLLHITGQKTNL